MQSVNNSIPAFRNRRAEDQESWTGSARLPLLVVILALLLSILMMPLQSVHAMPLVQDAVVVITHPTEGAILSGEVAIQGTATIPGFVSYGVLYASGERVTGSTIWQEQSPIAWNVQSMVVNGILGTWDTTRVPNGKYVLALVVYQAGSETPSLYFVNNLTVANEEATPTPEPTETPETEEPEIEATQEAEPLPPAPTIEQPPTATPRPTATPSPEEAAGTGNDGDDEGGLFSADIFSPDAIREAFTLGVQLAFLLYATGILYVLAKAVIRYYQRQSKGKPGP